MDLSINPQFLKIFDMMFYVAPSNQRSGRYVTSRHQQSQKTFKKCHEIKNKEFKWKLLEISLKEFAEQLETTFLLLILLTL